jgi:hypothetical protein
MNLFIVVSNQFEKGSHSNSLASGGGIHLAVYDNLTIILKAGCPNFTRLN